MAVESSCLLRKNKTTVETFGFLSIQEPLPNLVKLPFPMTSSFVDMIVNLLFTKLRPVAIEECKTESDLKPLFIAINVVRSHAKDIQSAAVLAGLEIDSEAVKEASSKITKKLQRAISNFRFAKLKGAKSANSPDPSISSMSSEVKGPNDVDNTPELENPPALPQDSDSSSVGKKQVGSPITQPSNSIHVAEPEVNSKPIRKPKKRPLVSSNSTPIGQPSTKKTCR